MTRTGTIIIGQGLCGTWLSFWLQQLGEDFLVIDRNDLQSSSRIASGVINPVTGRVLAETWMAGTLLPFCLEAYQQIGRQINIDCIRTVEILHCFPTEQMQQGFQKRLPQLPAYLSAVDDAAPWEKYFDIPHGLGMIHPALLIDLNRLLNHWQQQLRESGRYREGVFDREQLEIHDGKVLYQDILAERIIFCDGVASLDNPYFNRLPFAPNKGEALLVRIDELPSTHIYKKGFSLVPYPFVNGKTDEHYFWVGSTYENRFTETGATAAFRQRTEAQLKQWLKLPFTVLDHWAAVRPATVERRPFAGMHPRHPQVGLLNGTGTKGCSLAPWLARQLAGHIKNGQPIQPEAGIGRFAGILNS